MPDLLHDASIRRILIIKWSALGDIAMASCVMEDIHQAFPHARIDLHTLPPWDKLFLKDPRFSTIISLDVRARQHRWSKLWQWISLVRHNHYDLIVDLQSNDRSRMMLRLLKLTGNATRYLIGNAPARVYHFSGPPLHAMQMNPVERMRMALRAAGIPTRTPRPVLHIDAARRERVTQLCRQQDLQAGRYALFYPGCQAAGYLKRWGEVNYAALARLLIDRQRVDKVVLIGSQDEMEDCRRITEMAGTGVVNLCGQTEVLDIVPLAEGACYQVGNDTGTAHLAASAAVPMVVVCGPTDAYRVRPQGDNVVAMQADLACKNCYCKQACDHHTCMKRITPDLVFRALTEPAPADRVVMLPAS